MAALAVFFGGSTTSGRYKAYINHCNHAEVEPRRCSDWVSAWLTDPFQVVVMGS